MVVLVHLLFAHEHDEVVALVEVLDAAAGEDGEGFAGDRVGGEAGLGVLDALVDVEVVVEFFLAPGLGFDGVLGVGDAEGEVAALVLRGEAEHALFGLVLADQFAHAEERLDKALGEKVEDGGHLGEVVKGEQSDGAEAGGGEAAAVDEGALAEDVEVAGFVHQLGAQEELGLEEVGVDGFEEASGHIAGDELDLGEEGAERTHGALNVVGLVADGVPGDVAGAGPLALERLFVEQHGAFGPDIALVAVLASVGAGAGVGDDAAR